MNPDKKFATESFEIPISDIQLLENEGTEMLWLTHTFARTHELNPDSEESCSSGWLRSGLVFE